MDLQGPAHPERQPSHAQRRPYRSKRHRPCDVCRRRKHACIYEDRLPCKVCRDLGTACTFDEPPTKRRRQTRQAHNPSVSRQRSLSPVDHRTNVNDDAPSYVWSLNPNNPSVDLEASDPGTSRSGDATSVSEDTAVLQMLQHESHHNMWFTMLDPTSASFLLESEGMVVDELNSYQIDASFQPPSRPPSPLKIRGKTNQARYAPGFLAQGQSIRQLDSTDESVSAQFFGPSGEMDPYLLQHMLFPEDGKVAFGQFQYRQLMSPSSHDERESHIPANFLTHVNTPPKLPPPEESVPQTHDVLLENLISAEQGSRLIGLFLRYRFPSIPVLSRSHLKLKTETLIPQVKVTELLPSYLLAALYVSAEPFRRYDPMLNVCSVNTPFPRTELREIAYKGIIKQMHSPNLHLLQALLIYLQTPQEHVATASAEESSQWSLVGSTVNISHRLGLHIDCSNWPIPAWEKRLRRRIWWIVYSEAVWRSLLLGLPQLINEEDWDVSPLEDNDFQMDHLWCPAEETAAEEQAHQKPCPFCHGGRDFKYLTALALIAYDAHRSLFTTGATKRIANDTSASLVAGKELLNKLEHWKSRTPIQMPSENKLDAETRFYFHPGSSSHLKLAYLTLETLIWRAIMRPLTTLVAQETYLSDEERGTTSKNDIRLNQVSNAIEIPGENPVNFEETYRNCLNSANRTLGYAQHLGAYDCNGFSYSWSSACFSVLSNFIMLLLIQAPTKPLAKESLSILEKWVIVMREQSIVFETMRLGLLRLDSFFRMGLENTFRLPSHVKDTLRQELPTPRYQG